MPKTPNDCLHQKMAHMSEWPVLNLLMQFFTLGTSEDSETYFFDIVTPQYDHPSYVKHVLRHVHVFFTLLGY